MRPSYRLVVAVLLLTVTTTVLAQHEYDVWYFGWGYSLDFRGPGAPRAAADAAIWQGEGCASICSRTTGRPLFYSDGSKAWDRNHNQMPNGDKLRGNWTSAQSALIVPFPCDTNQYYLFTAGQQGYYTQDPAWGIHYSIVDMRLNGGLGDVTSVKNVEVQRPSSERLAAVSHANGRDYWVLTHSKGNNTFYAWLVNQAGVATTPVVSTVGVVQGVFGYEKDYMLGILKASPDGRKLAMTTWGIDLVELFDFDAETGRVSQPITLEGPYEFFDSLAIYGITFSPDNSKLYYAIWGRLFQHNLVPYTPAAIIASRTEIQSTSATSQKGITGAFQIGPDQRVYVNVEGPWIGVIDHPNESGQACSYAEQGISLFDRGSFAGLPNNIDARAPSYLARSAVRVDTSGPTRFCEGDSVVLTAPPGYRLYEWSTGERGRAIVARNTGIYRLVATDSMGCVSRVQVDVDVHRAPVPVIKTLSSPEFCAGDSVVLQTDSGFARYQWSDGTTGLSIVARSSGRYSLFVFDDIGCSGKTFVDVVAHPIPSPLLSARGPNEFCEGDEVVLDVSGGFYAYRWSTGDSGRSVTARTSGRYSVTVYDSIGCNATVSMDVLVHPMPRPVVNGVDRICDGDTTVLDAGGSYSSYRWSTGDTTRAIVVTESGTYIVTVSDSLGCQGASTPFAVTRKSPIVPALLPASRIDLCEGDSVRLIAPPGFTRYVWSTGDTTPAIVVRSTGDYFVRVQDSDGCSGESDTAVVVVHPLPPKPVITSGGDTLTSTPAAGYRWIANGAIVTGANGRQIIATDPGFYTVQIVDSNGCPAESDPFRVLLFHRFSLDTIRLRVGELGFLRLRASPPIDRREVLTGYRIRLRSQPHALYYHGVESPDHLIAGEHASMYGVIGSVVVERDSSSPVIEGEEVFRIQLEGLSSGTVLNEVSIDSLTFSGSDSTGIAGNGLVILSGCDVQHGFAVGLKVRILGVAPNPANDGAVVTYRAPSGSRPVFTLIDLAGRTVAAGTIIPSPPNSSENAMFRLSLAEIASGTYLLELRDGVERSVVPVTIVR